MLAATSIVQAQVYTYVDENGITVYTDRKPDSSRYQVENLGCFGTCRTGVDWDRTPLKNGQFADEVRAVSDAFGVDKALIRAVMHVESWFQADAVSSAGAQGLMQLMPGTQRRFGVRDPFDPVDNITAGTAYLAWLLDEFDGDLTRAVAAYNAGENAVRRHNGVPPYSETREYVRRVNIMYRRYRHGP
ncbi:lytic transglycosylase domain-containing protein [Wenzhouxiangella sp. AB-CW3]|uniref:lytic transglycosylase domain-containing protein n=1 Tax=Wenzhouxiangella sp. AB-CW3 TaxID=2771012 RepID=UPI00168B6B06|nr:lytic transglycosylase domain-containing protein [Wenzhouxiangella sp. AB-CW3]QOC23853.1 lytic transglycosylase domain-containing protein [Wenzhouxiangella sp. AB-CW3]